MKEFSSNSLKAKISDIAFTWSELHYLLSDNLDVEQHTPPEMPFDRFGVAVRAPVMDPPQALTIQP